MPIKLHIKRKLMARSERVKCVELHPTEPWLLAGLFNGNAYIWNIDAKKVLRTFHVSDLPVRAAKFISRKNWVVTATDDGCIRVFNYNTLDNVKQFAAHSDFIRSIVVHPIQPFILTSADDCRIKLWNWDRQWACTQDFRGHTYCVMQIVINPKDNNQFATAGLDQCVKVWQLGSASPSFSLRHENQVNCVDYHPGVDKPYLASGEDFGVVRIWDIQTKACVQILRSHSKDVNCVAFHPSLPIILSGSADGTLRIWHSSTYRMEKNLNYGLERVWSLACDRGSNNVAVGYDEGSVILKLGNEEPAVSMDASGKIIWAKHAELQQANIKAIGDQEFKDGESLSLAIKDMGSCDIYPQTISHSPNGRFVVVIGDGEYAIYTAVALRSKSFGSAQEFVWSYDPSMYATQDGGVIKVFKNFKEHKTLKLQYKAEGIFGGHLLGVRSGSNLSFYEWDSSLLVLHIEITPKHVFWSETGGLVTIVADDSFHVLRYHADVTERVRANEGVTPEDGVEDAFEVISETEEVVRTGLWLGDCFVYTTSINRLNYYVGGDVVTIAHLDRTMYLLGYLHKDNRLYLSDKELNIVSFSLLLSVLEYQTAVMRHDFDAADKILPTVPREQRTRVAHFLEKQGFCPQALAVSLDMDHKFDLAIQLKDLQTAHTLAKEIQSTERWKILSELAHQQCDFDLAQECLYKAQDLGGVVLLASSSGNRETMTKVAQIAEDSGQNNIAFVANFSLGRCEECLDLLIKTKRLPEAAFFARSYLPSQTSRVVSLWKEHLLQHSKKLSEHIADPSQFPNLFPDMNESLEIEQYFKSHREKLPPAAIYPSLQSNHERNPREEMLQAKIKDSTQKPQSCVQSTISSSVDDTSSKLMQELEEELDFDFENVSIDDFDLEDLELDESEILSD